MTAISMMTHMFVTMMCHLHVTSLHCTVVSSLYHHFVPQDKLHNITLKWPTGANSQSRIGFTKIPALAECSILNLCSHAHPLSFFGSIFCAQSVLNKMDKRCFSRVEHRAQT